MQYFILSVCSCLLVISCHNSSIQKTGVKTGTIASEEQKVIPTETIASTTESEEEETEESTVANIPISIGGASLTCRVTTDKTDEAACQARDANGAPFAVVVQEAFILQGSPAVWSPTEYRTGSAVGEYFVALPASVSANFGIALIYDQNKAVADWVVGADPAQLNLVKDGSFENLPITAGASFAQMPAANSPIWKSHTTATSNCGDTIGYLEVQNAGVPSSVPASHGNQWLELDAICSNNAGNGGNMATYQDVGTVVGNIYLLRFHYAHRVTDTAQETLVVRVGTNVVLETTVTDDAWKSGVAIFKASSNSIRLEFEEKGIANRLGTLLDNVQLFDLGASSQALGSKKATE